MTAIGVLNVAPHRLLLVGKGALFVPLLLWQSCVLGCGASEGPVPQRKFWSSSCTVHGTVRSNGVEMVAAAGGLTVVLVGRRSDELHHTKTTATGSFSFHGHAVHVRDCQQCHSVV